MVEVGKTYVVRLNHRVSQHEFNVQLDEVKLAGGRFVPSYGMYVVEPRLPIQASWLAKLADHGAELLS